MHHKNMQSLALSGELSYGYNITCQYNMQLIFSPVLDNNTFCNVIITKAYFVHLLKN